MARSNYSAGKRQREKERAKKKKEKMERARERSRSGGGGGVPVATVDEIQGGMMSIDQVMRNIEGGGDEEDGILKLGKTTQDLRESLLAQLGRSPGAGCGFCQADRFLFIHEGPHVL